jgi:hypothetical protein
MASIYFGMCTLQNRTTYGVLWSISKLLMRLINVHLLIIICLQDNVTFYKESMTHGWHSNGYWCLKGKHLDIAFLYLFLYKTLSSRQVNTVSYLFLKHTHNCLGPPIYSDSFQILGPRLLSPVNKI